MSTPAVGIPPGGIPTGVGIAGQSFLGQQCLQLIGQDLNAANPSYVRRVGAAEQGGQQSGDSILERRHLSCQFSTNGHITS